MCWLAASCRIWIPNKQAVVCGTVVFVETHAGTIWVTREEEVHPIPQLFTPERAVAGLLLSFLPTDWVVMYYRIYTGAKKSTVVQYPWIWDRRVQKPG